MARGLDGHSKKASLLFSAVLVTFSAFCLKLSKFTFCFSFAYEEIHLSKSFVLLGQMEDNRVVIQHAFDAALLTRANIQMNQTEDKNQSYAKSLTIQSS